MKHLLLALSLLGALPAQDSRESRPSCAITDHQGLRIVRLSGAPAARGEALGKALGAEIATILRAELRVRFASREPLLVNLRAMLPRLIAYPAEQRREIEGLFAGMKASGADLALPEFERAIDLDDLLLVNALDVFGMMGCSGFTVHGDRVEGGGVLTARNFDWPYSGPHLVEHVIVLVTEPEHGHAHACVTWPGYFGAVTAVNDAGIALMLHVGNGKVSLMPRRGSCPTASAARCILARGGVADAVRIAGEEVTKTSPPASYLTRVVLPSAGGELCPEHVLEADSASVSVREPAAFCVTTNHFLAHAPGRDPGLDSTERYDKICATIERLRADGDHKVSIDEAWQALASVQRSGRGFGTLHSLVFRHAPWHFELALGEPNGAAKVKGAPGTRRRWVIPRELLFR